MTLVRRRFLRLAGAAAVLPTTSWIPHLARNENTAMAKALVTHSRADKEKPLTVVVKRSS
jgi:hypothetical protein